MSEILEKSENFSKEKVGILCLVSKIDFSVSCTMDAHVEKC